ncbi:prolipoprotein diacylglyceryl transferase [Nakamurella endophytica]|uniref:Phosphatidylglycerol--prolipoprotein diacylglyceryl transferase n=1 Tax=Nakamurella endophytica TaxID=1748367 RepID=A0A917WBS8_9ACTN|nr:prolipoprotein diacylglyceryl transferase [Nakamurella endophytica]GGL90847.1 hypothetical protein GCM10011594_08120 [Nakamurella endophytica]
MSLAGVTRLPAAIPSPPQGVWYVGPLPVRAYALFIICGIVLAVWWGGRRLTARGGRRGVVTDIAVFAVPFGLIGGRLYHVITDNELYFRPGRNPWRAFAIWDGGLGIWGAIALGAVGAYLGCRRYGISFAAFADAVAPGVVAAQAIGRLGNYFNQELFGSPSSLPWALEVFVRTPGGVPGTQALCGPAGSAPEFPTQYVKAVPEILCGTYQPTFLYELLWDLAVAALLIWADRRFRLGAGQVFWLYVAGYTAGRGWIEMLRIDTANHFLGLRINVFTSIALFLVAVVVLVARRGRPRSRAVVDAPTAPRPGTDGTEGSNGTGGEGPDGAAGAVGGSSDDARDDTRDDTVVRSSLGAAGDGVARTGAAGEALGPEALSTGTVTVDPTPADRTDAPSAGSRPVARDDTD